MKHHAWKLGLICMMAAGTAALTGCDNPADHTPSAVVGEATLDEAPAGEPMAAPADAPAVEQVAYTITPENSDLEFIGSKVTGSHPCGFNQFSGEILIAGNDPTQGQVMLTIDMNSVYTDSGNLTNHLKSEDFFNVAMYPTSTFVSRSIKPGENGQFLVSGDLTLHGQTKNITFPATIEASDSVVNARAEFDIMRFDFGIEYKGQADNLIRNEVVIKFDLKAQRAAAPAA